MVVAVGILSLLAKLHKWDESAMLFDGSSLGVYIWIPVLPPSQERVH